MKSKKVTDTCIVDNRKQKRAVVLGFVTSYSPNQTCINRISRFLKFILTLFAFLVILLLKIDDFERKINTFSIEIEDFIVFSKFTGS